MYITQPHLLLHVACIHLCMDFQVFMSSAGKLRPCNRHLQVSLVGVTVDNSQRKMYDSVIYKI